VWIIFFDNQQKCELDATLSKKQDAGPLRASLGPGGTTLTGPPFSSPLQAASPPNQTSFVISSHSENTQVYTAGASLGYRISAIIRLCLP